MSIKARLCLVVVLMVLVILVGQSLFVYFQSKTTVERLVFDAIVTGATQNARLVDTWIRVKGEKLSLLSRNDVIRSMDWQEQLPLLQEVVAEEEDIEAIFISDLRGQARSVSGEVITIADRDYFQDAVRTGELAYSQPMLSRFTGAATVVIAQPIHDQEKVVGLLGATLLLDHLQSLVQEMKLSGYGYGWIIDANGNTVAHPNTGYVGNQDVFVGNPELRSLAQEMQKGKTGYGFYQLNGVSKALAYAPVPVLGWSIAMTADTQDIIAPAVKLRNDSVLITAAAVILGILVAYLVALYLVKPIIKLRDQVQKVAEGDLTVEVGVTSRDEIGQLGQALGTMTANLRMLIGAINAASDQVGTLAQQLNVNCEESAASAEETAARLNEIAGTVQQVVSEIELMSRGSEDAARTAAQGSDGAIQVTEQMNNIAQSSQRVGQSLEELHEQTSQINKVLALITSFAEQTNLLALNATIEAARAGEAGRGFAVVADEVRNLAEQSAQATADIQNLISSVQGESEEAVTLMQVNDRVVAEGATVVQTVGERFLEIGERVQDLKKQFAGILEATIQMAAGIEEISAASQEQTAASEEVAVATDELVQLSKKLNDLVQQFRV